MPGKTERRLALAILLTAVVPLAVALLLANSLFRQASAIWFNPDIGQQLDRGVDVYKDYVRAIKDDMRHQTDALAANQRLREASKRGDVKGMVAELGDDVFKRYPELVKVVVEDGDGAVIAESDRGRPVNDARERSLEVRRQLADDTQIAATFAIDRRRLDELDSAGVFVAKYHTLEGDRSKLYEGPMYAFAALLGITMLVTLVLGTLLARGVTRRINRLGAAISLVAEGDLNVRVPVTGSDELTNLAVTFNRMLGEMAQSRARIEFLQRIGAWQEMAKRLAHEIKNPLTPIQLAVQECHSKYAGDDPRYRALLDTTLEIVEEEVGTLRRLVGNFSNFARLPQAELREESLRDFLRECSEQLGHLDNVSAPIWPTSEDGQAGEGADGEPFGAQNVEVEWRVPSEPLPAAIDRQMLRRVLVNLVRNAVQAIRDARTTKVPEILGRVVVSARNEGDGAAIEVDDDGPGIAEDALGRVFDPYFTTKVDGTGLGLAIVKKIVVEHGGTIDVGKSAMLGGARFVVHLPGPRTFEITAARERASRAELTDGVDLPSS